MVLAIHEQLSLATSQKISLPDEVLCAIEGLNECVVRGDQLYGQNAVTDGDTIVAR